MITVREYMITYLKSMSRAEENTRLKVMSMKGLSPCSQEFQVAMTKMGYVGKEKTEVNIIENACPYN